MDLLWPQAVLLLVLVPILVAAYIWVLRRRRVALRYSSLALVRAPLLPFAFAAVPPASYTVTIETAGFSKYEQKGVVLRVGDSRSLRTVPLKVAGMSEEATVTASVDFAPLNSGEKSATLTSDQILNFSTVGRSAAELLKVLPGMTPVTQGVSNRPGFTGEVIGINGNGEYQGGGNNNQSAIGNYSGNGTRTEALDITVDGAPGADPGCNCATSVNPNPEMVQEFKVLQSNFGAEHAKGPVAMTVVSKQGGREFHGTLYTYLRDYHLNSNEWFANKVGKDRVKNKFLYPGFNVSGPVLVPGTDFNKNRDKVFFFLGYEYFKQALDTGFVKSWVPTAAMRNGDFSQAASYLGPGTGGTYVNSVPAGFPGGMIPPGQIDPGGRALLNVFPQPNANPAVTGGYNYVDNLLVDQNGTQLLGRVDFNVSENTKLFVRYNRQREVQPFVIGLWWRNGARQVPYPSSISAANRSDSATASLTHVFNPTLTNETLFAVTYIDFPNAFDDRSKITRTELLEKWNSGWNVLLKTLETLTDEDLMRSVSIRGVECRVHDALHRSVAHTSYHVGQIVILAKGFRGSEWESLSIPKGKSEQYNQNPDPARERPSKA